MSNLALDREPEFEPAHGEEVAAMQELRPVPRISIQAFCETDSVAKPMERAMADRRLARAHMRVERGGVSSADFGRTALDPGRIVRPCGSL